METTTTRKKLGDIIGLAPFHPDVQKVDLNSIVNSTFVLVDAKIVKDFHSQFGSRPCAFILLMDEVTGLQYKTISSGQVIVDQIAMAISKRAFNTLVTVVQVPTEDEKFYYKFA